MANIKLQEKLTAVADAIRAKNGSSEKLTLDQMPAEIGNIQSGSGSAARDYEVNDVTFYDFDGTIIYSCSMVDAQNLTELPTPPEHKGLVFQEWNWTLEQIKRSSVGADVGAMYDTEDGAVVFNITIANEIERSKISLAFEKASVSTNPPRIKIDWGDGTTDISENVVSIGGIRLYHVYDKNGTYNICVKRENPSTDGFGIKYNMSSNYTLISLNSSIDNIINYVRIGSDCAQVGSNTFVGCNEIKYITVHKDLTLPNTAQLFSDSSTLKCLILPQTQVNMYDLIDTNNSIHTLCIPPTVISCRIGQNRLSRIIFPDSVNVVEKFSSGYCSMTEFRLGNNVWKISSYAFSNVNRIISVLRLPASIKTLESSCLSGFRNLKEIHIAATTPPSLASSSAIGLITSGDEKTKIYVPAGCAEAYKSATNWAALADYIIEEGK